MTNKKFKLAAMSLATAVAVSTVGPSASAVTYYLGDGSVTVDKDVDRGAYSYQGEDGKRTYEWPVVIRAVNSVDATAATVEEIPYPTLHRITDRILAEVKGVSRVLYDLSPKPVATIEWE